MEGYVIKATRIIICFIFFALVLLANIVANAGTGSVTFSVDGTIDGFQDTGVSLQAGEVVNLTASGIVCHNSGSSCADANGWDRPTDDSFLAPGLTEVSLVGKIGSGSPFFVGTSLNLNSGQSGELYLGFNDNYFADNGGSFLVTISGFICDLSITSLTSSSQTLSPSAGESVTISGSLNASLPINWTAT